MLNRFRIGLAALALSVATAIAAIAASAAPAFAQEWPQRAVRFILPFGPGSAADTLARVLGEDLAVRWGQPVVVENRPGADGLLAINAVVGAKDDHTILVSSTGSFLAHPYMHKKLDYNIDRDLTPIARVADTLLIVAVPADLPVKNLKDFVALATEFGVSLFLPELIVEWGRDGEMLGFVTSILQASGAETGNIQINVNPRLYTWSAALYLALALASRSDWSNIPLALALLLPLQAWGIAFSFLMQVGISADPAVTAQVGLEGLAREGVALAYQLGTLILPPLSPVVLWAAFDTRLLPQLRSNSTQG